MKPTAAAAACLAILLLHLQAQESTVAIRAKAMVDVERGRLIENAIVVVRGCLLYTSPSPRDS